jgi:hypothetical protein
VAFWGTTTAFFAAAAFFTGLAAPFAPDADFSREPAFFADEARFPADFATTVFFVAFAVSLPPSGLRSPSAESRRTTTRAAP